jgi:hypothetical protein
VLNVSTPLLTLLPAGTTPAAMQLLSDASADAFFNKQVGAECSLLCV